MTGPYLTETGGGAQLGGVAGEGLFHRGNHGFPVADRKHQGLFAFCLEFVIGRSEGLNGLEGHLGTSFIRSQGDRRIRTREVVVAWEGERHGERLAIVVPGQQSRLLLWTLLQMDGNRCVIRNMTEDPLDIFSPNGLVESSEKPIDSFTSEAHIPRPGVRLMLRQRCSSFTMGCQERGREPGAVEDHVSAYGQEAESQRDHEGWSLKGTISGWLSRILTGASTCGGHGQRSELD